jgi:hypothetical protein
VYNLQLIRQIEIRNSKHEIRNKSKARNPKSASCAFGPSNLGFVSDFGFRASDFGCYGAAAMPGAIAGAGKATAGGGQPQGDAVCQCHS